MRIDRVRIAVWPWLFALPYFRRFDGYSAWNLILLREPVERSGVDLVTHELCHVWQMQHKPLAMPLSYLRGYARNPHELEARRAVELTRERRS
ncbi:MAG TPA: hypothetical protein VJT84_14550 [Gaiellaceae bacterium]|nr:hypothetical protein [Gaiellaceae bacterium]